ncbi:MAG: GAF domain-containing protein [Anaerolineales bacterium]|nr:GAF domain-containing protein [Anaerolineales bacterium]MDW8161679.1 GAF domain-containing protein [Anaerolineales bacterium]
MNSAAKELYRIGQRRPTLEGLARRANPSEAFLSLCAAEGRARFTVEGRLFEGVSFRIPYTSGWAMLISLQRFQLFLSERQHPSAADGIPRGLEAFVELIQAMTLTQDLSGTLSAIFHSVGRVIPFDASLILLWDQAQQLFVPYFWKSQEDHYALERGEPIPVTEELRNTPWLFQREVTLWSGTQAEEIKRTFFFPFHAIRPFPCLLSAPLWSKDEYFGLLILASLFEETYTAEDLDVLRRIADLAANALRNARLYESQQKQLVELTGFVQLSQAVNALSDPEELFAQLIKSYAPLLGVRILGFLLYDEERRILEAQSPFLGIPPSALEFARYSIRPESEAARWLNRQEAYISEEATQDEVLGELEFARFAQAVGIRHLALQPLLLGGRVLGFLLAAEKDNGEPFCADDLRILSLMAAQTASLIEHVRLMQQVRRRALAAETLRRITKLTNSSAELDEILQHSVLDLARLFGCDVSALFLFNEAKGELSLHQASTYGIEPQVAGLLKRILVNDPRFPNTVTARRVPLLCGSSLEDPNVLAIYNEWVGPLQLDSVLTVPITVRDQVLGEWMFGSRKPNFFSQVDVQTASTAAAQLASAIERAELYSQTDESLRRRVTQLAAITRISREINSSQDLEHLLERIYEEALNTTGADCGTLRLFGLGEPISPSVSEPQMVSYFGDSPPPQLRPEERWVTRSGESIVIGDYSNPQTEAFVSMIGEESEAARRDLQPPHPEVRSALVVPILYQDRVVGLIHLHSKHPRAFDPAAQEVAESLATQAAIAIGNARRAYDQARHRQALTQEADALAKILEVARSLQFDLSLEKAFENLAHALRSITPFQGIAVHLYDPQSALLRPFFSLGLEEDQQAFEGSQLAWPELQALLEDRYRFGKAYFIPVESQGREQGTAFPTPLPVDQRENGLSNYFSWKEGDLFLLPLFDSNGQILGLIRMDKPRDHLRPDHSILTSLEVIALQAGLILETHLRISQLQEKVRRLDAELEQTRHLNLTLHSQLSQQLESQSQQNSVIERYRSLGERIQVLLQIGGELVNYSNRQELLCAVGRVFLEKLNYQTVLLAEAAAGGLRLMEVFGELEEPLSIEPLLGQRNPLLTSLRNRRIEMVASLEKEGRWQDSPLLHALRAQGFVCLPILPQDAPEAVLLAISQNPLPPFLAEDAQLLDLLGRQIAFALRQLSLMEEIEHRFQEVDFLLDFSRQLSSLEPQHIVKALLQALLHQLQRAEAGMIAIWDAQQQLLVPQAVLGYSDNEAIRRIRYAPGASLVGKVFSSGEAVLIEELDFAQHYQLSIEELTAYRQGTNGRLPISCLVMPLKGSAQMAPIGVLVLDNFRSPSAFTQEDLALVSSLCQQAALHLENSRLFHASRQRAAQLQALTNVSASVTAKLSPDELIASLLDELAAIVPYHTGTLWLRKGKNMVIAAARGFPDQEQRIGLSVFIEDSELLSEMIRTAQPIVVANTLHDPRFPKFAEQASVSWLGLPLAVGGNVLGVIALEHAEVGFFNPETVQIAATFASQAAVSLENARLYQESLARAAELSEQTRRLAMLNRLAQEFSRTLDPDQILRLTIEQVLQVTRAEGAMVVLFDSSGMPLVVAEKPSRAIPYPLSIASLPVFDRMRESPGVFLTEDVTQEKEWEALREPLAERQARSLLVLPIATADALHGAVLAYLRSRGRFPAEQVDLARTVVNQAAVALQNARLYAETRSLSQELEKRVQERTLQLASEHQRTQILLRIATELTASLDLEHVLDRVLPVLNELVGAEQVAVMVVRADSPKLYHLASLGYAPPPPLGGQPSPFGRGEGLAGWVIKTRQPALIADVRQDSRWVPLADRPTEHRSAMAVPMIVGEEALGALLFFHRQPNRFTAAQLDLVMAAANQMAIAVNNAELYRLIRDQAEDLGATLRRQQIETSRTRAILEAVADGVLVTDANGRITLFNASAERILNLPRQEVIGKNLDQFPGLFGSAATRWMQTIQTWSRQPKSYSPQDIYSEQIELDNGRVVAVNLAPVLLRNDFIGTVSVFRDITHQVEVDRLKSEFVATVSHELRTPMTSIKGYVELLLMGAAGALSEQQTRFLEIIRSNTERLAALVGDLLDISRIEAGKVGLSLQPLNMIDLARRSLAEIRDRSVRENKPMRFELSAEEPLPFVQGDPDRVMQILDNLLENAYLYSDPGRTVRVHLHSQDTVVQVDVIDQGVGVPPALQERIFERFYRGENPYVLATYGTGLGLSIVKRLVEMHGGKIWVQSSGIEGEGSVFSFTLPIFAAKS